MRKRIKKLIKTNGERIGNKKALKTNNCFRFVLGKASSLFLAFVLILSQSQLLNAFEAHVINVTAKLDNYPVVLNEILPNPAGDDCQVGVLGEWVELYNTSDRYYDAEGWVLTDADNNQLVITDSQTYSGDTVLPAFGFLVVLRTTSSSCSSFELGNKGDTVNLYTGDPATSVLMDSYTYTGMCSPPTPGQPNNCDGDIPESKSLARIPDGIGIWYDPIPTPGAHNTLEDDFEELLLEVGMSEVQGLEAPVIPESPGDEDNSTTSTSTESSQEDNNSEENENTTSTNTTSTNTTSSDVELESTTSTTSTVSITSALSIPGPAEEDDPVTGGESEEPEDSEEPEGADLEEIEEQSSTGGETTDEVVDDEETAAEEPEEPEEQEEIEELNNEPGNLPDDEEQSDGQSEDSGSSLEIENVEEETGGGAG